MLSISDREGLMRALTLPIDRRLKQLLTLRRDQLGGDITALAQFAIVQPRDNALDLEDLVGFSVFQNPADGSRAGDPDFSPGWEWIEDHGFAYELCFIMDDSGFAHVVIVPRTKEIDPELIQLCRTYASEHA